MVKSALSRIGPGLRSSVNTRRKQSELNYPGDLAPLHLEKHKQDEDLFVIIRRLHTPVNHYCICGDLRHIELI